ncbi:diacylglycerol kinase family protein [Cohnella luojiensis]|uniref:Diacylglycerol kinase family protein n=1 Tax=Cohnella luojiensis TaxID=652876 RepID=A0A4Y8M8K1_9BACL|nr:diacylglycerol kinase family protein [Cohnella luojiensis]TFE31678.1 diacylglycerol kinase family protein [Cohnella luojiensis]
MSGWRSREVRSFRNAVAGIWETFRSERHMRFHLVAAFIVIAIAAWCKLERWEWLWLIAAISSVWVAELFNTAIERTVDRHSLDVHPLAKAAKDTAAGAVLIAALFAVTVGSIVLGPPLWKVCFQ